MGSSMSSNVYKPKEQEANNPSFDITPIINEFTVKFFRQMAINEANFVASPLGLNVVLSILQTGASGHTAKELTAALGHLADGEFHDNFYLDLGRMTSTENITLKVASSVWIREGLDVEQSFEDIVTRKFRAEIIRANFRDDPSLATSEINEWASGRTHAMVKNPMKESFSPETSVVIVNANCFQGQWKLAFKREAAEKFFNEGSRDKVSFVHLMHQKKRFKFFKDTVLKAKFLEVDYEDGRLAMIFIVPSSSISLQQLEGVFTHEAYWHAYRSMKETNVHVALPIFEIETNLLLNDDLIKFGIRDIFNPQANFSNGIAQRVSVSAVVQKSVIKMEDAGCEESAEYSELSSSPGTPHDMRRRSPTSRTQRFRVDRPFLFVIKDNISNIIVFIGRVTTLPHAHHVD